MAVALCRCRVASINVLRDRLYLLATLPPKPGKGGPDEPWKQQRIALRLDLTPANRKVAQRRLVELERQLERGTFDWGYWEEKEGTMRWRDAINALYRERVVLGHTSQRTWDTHTRVYLRHADPVAPCTTASIEREMLRYSRESKSYKEVFYLLRNIARVAGVVFPEVPKPIYHKSAPPLVPSDNEIEEVLDLMNPTVRWYLAMMATYGLRPHEIEGSEMLDRDRLLVGEATKTGSRVIIPCPQAWVERFELRDRQQRDYQRRGGDWGPDPIASWLWRHLKAKKVEWRPYALRHGYAGRLWRTGGNRLDIYTAARLMGHSPAQHVKTYRAHVDPNTIADAAEQALLGGRGQRVNVRD